MVVAFGLAWRLRDVRLRETAGAAEIGEGAGRRETGSDNELEPVPAPSAIAIPSISRGTRRPRRSGAGVAGLRQQA
jgi:hypothetical protein